MIQKPKIEEPKDIQAKVVPKGVAKWTQVRDGVKVQIEKQEMELEINKHILVFAEKKITEEQSKS